MIKLTEDQLKRCPEPTAEQAVQFASAIAEAARLIGEVGNSDALHLILHLRNMFQGDLEREARAAIVVGLSIAAVVGKPSLMSVSVLCKMLMEMQERDPGFFADMRRLVGADAVSA